MQVTMMLADAAQSVGNKLYVLGGGWSLTGPQPTPSALAIHIKVPWDQANVRHKLRVELIDQDGRPVIADGPEGEQDIRIESEFEVGRPAGLKSGTPIDVSIAINVPPLPLPPGGRFEWRLFVDEQTSENWYAAFGTRASNV